MPQSKTAQPPQRVEPLEPTWTRGSTVYDNLPLRFEANRGQTDAQVKYLVRGHGFTLFLTATEVVLALLPSQGKVPSRVRHPAAKPQGPAEPPTVLRLQLLDANVAPQVVGQEELPGKSNYFIGNDSQKWRTNVPNYAKVVYQDVYPGVNVVYYGNQKQLEYDFIVTPGADPRSIVLAFEGTHKLRLDTEGNLILSTAGGELLLRKPRIYQEDRGVKQTLPGRYVLRGKHRVGFEIAAYDSGRPLVIDPVLTYATYLGGTSFDAGVDIAVDAAGNAYVTGYTSSPDFPINIGALQPEHANLSGLIVTGVDVFVSKIDPTGATLLYSTYLGGSGTGLFDRGHGIAVDAAGNAYVTGRTNSLDFPTVNPIQPVFGGEGGFSLGDAFVSKIDPTGATLLYSTYLGGSGDDEALDIAVDAAGNAYVTGRTLSPDFPLANPLQPVYGGGFFDGDVFITKLGTNGTGLLYSTYLGGSDDDGGSGIAVDTAGNAYVTGETASEAFPTTPGVLQPSLINIDVFVTKLNATGSALLYSSYLGGGGVDTGNDIAIDAAGNAYITGRTDSPDFPTVNPIQPVLAGGGLFSTDAFVSKIDSTATTLFYSTYLGGSDNDVGLDIAIDAAGNAYITGRTLSPDFPTANPLQSDFGGGDIQADVFVAKVSITGSSLLYSTYLGGSGSDEGSGIDVDRIGNAFITGSTNSADFPIAGSVLQPNLFGSDDAFVAKLAADVSVPETTILPNHGGDTGSVSALIHGSGFLAGATVRLVRDGEADIVGESVLVGEDGTFVFTTFDLVGKTRGAWDVVVTNPDATTTTLAAGFTIEQGRAAQIWVDIMGRQQIRVGRENTFTIVYGNRGNVNAKGVPLWIAGIPKDADWRTDFEIIPPPAIEGSPDYDWELVPAHIETEDEILLPLLVSPVPPDFVGTLRITLTVPTERTISLRVWADAPISQSPILPNILDCFITELSEGLNLIGLIPGVSCFSQAGVFFDTLLVAGLGELNNRLNERLLNRATGQNHALSIAQLLTSGIGFVSSCSGFSTLLGTAAAAVNTILALPQALECLPGASQLKNLLISVVGAIDPNEKVGAPGIGQNRYLSGEEPLRYVIFFENLETATAPAQEVRISDQLDVTNLDLSTLSLGLIAFGDTEVIPTAGLSPFTTEVDLRPNKSLLVRIEVDLDPDLGLLIWHFTALDPDTGERPEDPIAGFLPPNVNPPAGEGSVLFTVMPKKGLLTGTEIRNQASIVFDVNPPIDTPAWLNTLDNTRPDSQVLSLAAMQASPSFEVQWSGTDEGSGISNYTIFVSVDGSPYTVWLPNTTATTETFSGQSGRLYAFYSIAQDQTSNMEEVPAVADTTTQVSGCRPDGDVNQDGDLTPADALLAFQHFLGIANPPLTDCQQDRANPLDSNSTGITPADALCIFQKFLVLPSCLD